MSETWAEAYFRILAEVESDMPNADPEDQYLEYRSRVQVYKHERGLS